MLGDSVKFPTFKELPIKDKRPYQGLFLDIPRSEIPNGGWATMLNFHVYNEQIVKFAGWENYQPGSNPLTTDNNIIFGLDFVKENRDRYFILATKTKIYVLDRGTFNLVVVLNLPFTGTDQNRWQSAVMNDKLIMTNGVNKLVTITDAVTTGDLGADAQRPKAARYVLNVANHLICGYVTDQASNVHTRRVQWSDIDDFTTWTPSTANEAGFLDIEEGEIRGMASLGPNQFLVWSEDTIYVYTYVGYPLFFTKFRVVDDIGLTCPYSLIVKEDIAYWLGTEGFYSYNGVGTPRRIGLDKVDSFFFSQFDTTVPESMYAFTHPVFPEIWFTYYSKGSTFFDSALVYNWEKGVWSQRKPFPMSFMAVFLSSSAHPWTAATGTWAQATVTWEQKRGSGAFLVLGGDSKVYLHGFSKQTLGVDLVGVLESGDIRGRNKFESLSHMNYGLDSRAVDLVQSQVGSKTKPEDDIVYSVPFILDDDNRHDIMLVDKIFGFKLTTAAFVALTDFSLFVQGAGDRM